MEKLQPFLKAENIKVSVVASSRRSQLIWKQFLKSIKKILKVLVYHLQSKEDREKLVTEKVEYRYIFNFYKKCEEYLEYIKANTLKSTVQ